MSGLDAIESELKLADVDIICTWCGRSFQVEIYDMGGSTPNSLGRSKGVEKEKDRT